MKAIVTAILLFLVSYLPALEEPTTQASANETISQMTVKGLTGKVRDVAVRAPAPTSIQPVSAVKRSEDIDLQRMAQWGMNYLIRSPRKELDYEPVFQANPMNCPPVPSGHDVVVACDTDARMDWEWYYMREISGSKAGKDVEAAFHKRMLAYVREDGTVLRIPAATMKGTSTRSTRKRTMSITSGERRRYCIPWPRIFAARATSDRRRLPARSWCGSRNWRFIPVPTYAIFRPAWGR